MIKVTIHEIAPNEFVAINDKTKEIKAKGTKEYVDYCMAYKNHNEKPVYNVRAEYFF